MGVAPSSWVIPHWDLSVGILLHIQTPDCAVRRFSTFDLYRIQPLYTCRHADQTLIQCLQRIWEEKSSDYVCLGVCAHFWQLKGPAMTCNFIIYQQKDEK